MRSILGMLAIVALVAFAVPAMAQQETNTGQDKPTQGQQAGDQGMTNDTSAVGREHTGVATETTKPTQTTEPSQVTPPVTERAATTGEREEGGAMPTTASSLPGLALVGVLLIGAGLGLRYMRGRS